MDSIFNNYVFLGEIGKGYTSTIYKVIHKKLGYTCAIKILKDKLCEKENIVMCNEFYDTSELLLRIGSSQHKNIIQCYDYYIINGYAVMELEYIDGYNLTEYLALENGFIKFHEIQKLLIDISSALAFCHSINKGRIIHNDIHFENIMRRKSGGYILLDFASAFDTECIYMHNGDPEYRPPEKWNYGSAHLGLIGPYSDIYSFGITLFKFMTGRVPFVYNKNYSSFLAESELCCKHRTERVPDIFEFRKNAYEKKYVGKLYKKDYPKWIEMLIKKSLSKNIDDRFCDGTELYNYVKNML